MYYILYMPNIFFLWTFLYRTNKINRIPYFN